MRRAGGGEGGCAAQAEVKADAEVKAEVRAAHH